MQSTASAPPGGSCSQKAVSELHTNLNTNLFYIFQSFFYLFYLRRTLSVCGAVLMLSVCENEFGGAPQSKHHIQSGAP